MTTPTPTPIRSGYRSFGAPGTGEAGINWWLFPGTLTDEEALWGAGNPERSYGGPGQYFSRSPRVRRTRTRVLVTQWDGWDI